MDEQLNTLEGLLDEAQRVKDLVDELAKAADEADVIGVDDGCRRDIDEVLIKAKNRSQEVGGLGILYADGESCGIQLSGSCLKR